MKNTEKALIIAIVILIALAAIGCDSVNESAETVLEAGETVAEVGTVHGMLKDLANQNYAQPNTK